MSVQKVTTVSWFQRIGRSVTGMLAGIVLVPGMVALLFWNEGSAVTAQRSLDEGAGIVVSADTLRIDPANEGKLVHVSGNAVAEQLTDPDFGFAAPALRLERTVEMYQWVETSRTKTQKNLGGSETQITTYDYRLDWSKKPEDSSRFQQPDGHANPPMMIREKRLLSQQAALGAFRLGENIVASIGGAKTLHIDPSYSASIRAAAETERDVAIVDGAIFLGLDSMQPRLGDYRISYTLVPPGPVSIVGRQSGEGFSAYRTEAGDTLLLMRSGVATAEDMFADAASANSIMTWILRAVGLVLLVVGFSTILAPLSVIASVIPMFGSIVGAGTGFVAMICGIAVGSLTIATAWLFYRPLTALLVLLVAALAIVVVRKLGRKRPDASADTARALV